MVGQRVLPHINHRNDVTEPSGFGLTGHHHEGSTKPSSTHGEAAFSVSPPDSTHHSKSKIADSARSLAASHQHIGSVVQANSAYRIKTTAPSSNRASREIRKRQSSGRKSSGGIAEKRSTKENLMHLLPPTLNWSHGCSKLEEKSQNMKKRSVCMRPIYSRARAAVMAGEISSTDKEAPAQSRAQSLWQMAHAVRLGAKSTVQERSVAMTFMKLAADKKERNKLQDELNDLSKLASECEKKEEGDDISGFLSNQSRLLKEFLQELACPDLNGNVEIEMIESIRDVMGKLNSLKSIYGKGNKSVTFNPQIEQMVQEIDQKLCVMNGKIKIVRRDIEAMSQTVIEQIEDEPETEDKDEVKEEAVTDKKKKARLWRRAALICNFENNVLGSLLGGIETAVADVSNAAEACGHKLTSRGSVDGGQQLTFNYPWFGEFGEKAVQEPVRRGFQPKQLHQQSSHHHEPNSWFGEFPETPMQEVRTGFKANTDYKKHLVTGQHSHLIHRVPLAMQHHDATQLEFAAGDAGPYYHPSARSEDFQPMDGNQQQITSFEGGDASIAFTYGGSSAPSGPSWRSHQEAPWDDRRQLLSDRDATGDIFVDVPEAVPEFTRTAGGSETSYRFRARPKRRHHQTQRIVTDDADHNAGNDEVQRSAGGLQSSSRLWACPRPPCLEPVGTVALPETLTGRVDTFHMPHLQASYDVPLDWVQHLFPKSPTTRRGKKSPRTPKQHSKLQDADKTTVEDVLADREQRGLRPRSPRATGGEGDAVASSLSAMLLDNGGNSPRIKEGTNSLLVDMLANVAAITAKQVEDDETGDDGGDSAVRCEPNT